MAIEATVIVADAHLYHTPGSLSDALFHRFLRTVPDLGDHLIINGDLFDFWFEYRAVIPRRVFPTLVALSTLRERGVRITLTGGNHDRWGGPFWSEQLDAGFHSEGCDMSIAGLPSRVQHGDGLHERHAAARFLHWATRRPIVRGVFRAIHPDIGFWGVRKMSRVMGESTRSGEVIADAADRQRAWALDFLERRPDIRLLVLSHTHQAALVEPETGRWYLNPGPWMDESRYAIVTSAGPELRVFDRDVAV